MDLLAPARSLDTVQSLVAMSKAAGFFPKWPIGDGEAGTMIGASAATSDTATRSSSPVVRFIQVSLVE